MHLLSALSKLLPHNLNLARILSITQLLSRDNKEEDDAKFTIWIASLRQIQHFTGKSLHELLGNWITAQLKSFSFEAYQKGFYYCL